ncbi:MAG: hypothetical protein ABIH72_00510 [archaeon]
MKGKLVLLFLGVLLVASVVSAIPGIPHQFYGQVTVNGQPANNNILKAVCEGDEYITLSLEGKYGYNPNIFYVADPDGDRMGQTITFYLGSKKVGETKFVNNELTELNIATTTTCGDSYCLGDETCTSCSQDCGICTDPPIINIISPEAKDYDSDKIDLKVTSDQNILIWMYSLNGKSFVTFTPDIIITAEEGENDLTVIGLNSVFLTGQNSVKFTVTLSYCGNGICDVDKGESCSSCSVDCGACSSGDTGGSSSGGGSGSSGGGGAGGGILPPAQNLVQQTGDDESNATEDSQGNLQEPTTQEANPGILGAVLGLGGRIGNPGLIIAGFVIAIIIISLIVAYIREKRK